MHSTKKRCLFGCANFDTIIHRFPHPERRPESFLEWMSIARVRLQFTDPLRVFKTKRICDFHFKPEDKVGSHRISESAVPCLHLNGVFQTTALVTLLEHNYSIARVNLPSDITLAGRPATFQPENEVLHRMNPDTTEHPSTSQTSRVHVDAALHRINPVTTEHPSTSQVHADAVLRLNPDISEHPSTSQVGADAALLRLNPDISEHPSTSQVGADAALLRLNPDISEHPSTSQVGDDAVLRLNPDISEHPSTSQVGADADLQSKSLETILKKLKNMKKENRKLRRRIKKSVKKEKAFRNRLAKAQKAITGKAFQTITKNMTTAGRIFTGIQYRQTLKKRKGRRYNLEEKVLSLSLYKKSPKCYTMLSNYFTLPSAKSLRNLLAQVKLTPGTNKIIFEKIKETVSKLTEEEKLCTLMFDEMSITPKIHYTATTDEFKGFISHSKELKIATHALVFMIKGIKMNYKQPVAYYFTENINKIDLKNIIVQVIRNLNTTGLKVVATVCDQGSANAGAIKSLIEDEKRISFQNGVELRYDFFQVDGQTIVPIFDVPHLIKGIRNNLLTKDLIFIDYADGNKTKTVKWEYFQMIYQADKSYKELRLLPKITEEHVNPDKIKKMRVKLAAQIFSRSVAAAARHMAALGDVPQECTQIIPFILLIDHLFDSLNAGTFHVVKGKEYRAGVKKNSPHHILWANSIKILKSVKYLQKKGQLNKIRVVESVAPSITNLIKTIEGMQALWVTLSQKFSLDIMLTRNFNQDPIENFFGNIRSLGARNISPDCLAFEAAFKTLLLNNYSSPQAFNANCEEDFNNCLQNFDFLVKEQSKYINTDHTDADENDTNVDINQRMYDRLCNDNVDDSSKYQQRSYVCGWILTKCLKKVVKSCVSCRNTIVSSKNNPSTSNNFIRAKEYHTDKEWLSYPSDRLINCFNEIQDLTTAHLKTSVERSNTKRNIIRLINSFVAFPFHCTDHSENLKKYFCDLSVNILIHSWCRTINRILSGKITYSEGPDDPIKQAAQIYYDKHKHRGKNN